MTTRTIITTATLLALLAAPWGEPASAEVFSALLGGPVPADGDGGLRLIVPLKGLSGEESFIFVSQAADGAWQAGDPRTGAVRAAALAAGRLYIFTPKACTVYQPDMTWLLSLDWDQPWVVTAALGGAELWAFGHDVHSGSEPEPKADADEMQWRLRAAYLHEDQWLEPPNAPVLDRPAWPVRAARLNGVPYVFWPAPKAGDARDAPATIYYAPVTIEGWGETASIAGIAPATRFAVAGGSRIHLWMHNAARGISATHPVTYRSFDGKTWSEPEVIAGLEDPRMDRTLYLAAGTKSGRPTLVLGSRQVVRIIEREPSGRWAAPAGVYELPILLRVEFVLAGGLLFGLLLIGVGVSLWRARRSVTVLETPEGLLMVADWRLRAAATTLDGLMMAAIYMVTSALLADSQDLPGQLGLLVTLHLLSVPYFAAFELAGGQSPGKRMAGIAVVSRDGSAPAPWRILARTLVRPIDTFLMAPLGMLFILNTRGCQRLGDVLAGTLVVRIPPASNPEQHSEPDE